MSGNLLSGIFESKKRRFVITIGDEGAILTLFNGTHVSERLFSDAPNNKSFELLLEEHKTVPVSVLVDVLDQAYVPYTFPPVNSANARSLIKRKLKKEFSDSDIKGYVTLSRNKMQKNEWRFLLAATRYTSPLSDWLDFVASCSNPMEGVFLLPLEASNLLHDIVRHSPKSEKKNEWHMLITHNRVGGIRQTIFHNEEMLFTRITQPVGANNPEVLSGGIEQEALNTLEYIRRLDFEDEDGLSVFFIVSPEVKKHVNPNAFHGHTTHAYTPRELSDILGYGDAIKETDQFSDIISALHFSQSRKKTLKLQTPQQKLLTKANQISFAALSAVAAMILSLIYLNGVSALDIFEQSEKSYQLEVQNQQREKKAQKFRDFEQRYTEEAKKIISLTNVYQKLAVEKPPLLFSTINLYSDILEQNSNNSVYSFYATGLKGKVAFDEYTPKSIETVFNIKFRFPRDASVDQILDEIDFFASDVERGFREYEVNLDYKAANNLMTLNLEEGAEEEEEGTRDIPITLRVVGPQPPVTNETTRN